MGQWIENEDSNDLPEVEIGDIVHFKLVDAFSYCVKGIVDSVEESTVIAIIEAVFDWESGGEVTSGDMTELEGEEVELGYEFIHEVIGR